MAGQNVAREDLNLLGNPIILRQTLTLHLREDQELECSTHRAERLLKLLVVLASFVVRCAHNMNDIYNYPVLQYVRRYGSGVRIRCVDLCKACV